MDITAQYKLFKESLQHRDEWLAFLKSWCDNKETFLRRVGFPNQAITVRNIDAIYNLIYKLGCDEQAPCFMSVYEFRGYAVGKKRGWPDTRTAKRDRLYYDFDCTHRGYAPADLANLPQAYEDAKTVHRFFREQGQLYFTGGRGFALHINLAKELRWPVISKHLKRGYYLVNDIDPNLASELGKIYSIKPHKLNKYLWSWHKRLIEGVCTSEREQQQLTKLIMSIPEQIRRKNDRMRLETVDTSVCGVVIASQQCRMPYTLHQKTGRFCIPIEPDWSLEKVIAESEKLQIPKPAITESIWFKDDIVSPKNVISTMHTNF